MSYSWTDDPLTINTVVRQIHIQEIHDAVNTERTRRGLSGISGKIYDTILTSDINDLRQALDNIPPDNPCSSDNGAEHTSHNNDFENANYTNYHDDEDISQHVSENTGLHISAKSNEKGYFEGSNYGGTYSGRHSSNYYPDSCLTCTSVHSTFHSDRCGYNFADHYYEHYGSH